MPRSSGTYSLPAGNPVVTGTVISTTWANNTLNDISNEITNSLPRDGTAPPLANIPFGNYKITGLGAATFPTDAAQYQQVQSGATNYLTAVSGADTITANLSSPTLTAYAAGNTFRFTAVGNNTGAVTLNINGLGAKDVTKNGATALIAGDITSSATIEVVYDGTRFQLIGTAKVINEAQGSDIASAGTVNLTTATGNYVHITGTTTITAVTLAQGAERTVVFDGALTLTNGASLLLPTSANITTAAGDTAIFRGEAAGVVRCISYTRKNGSSLGSREIAAAGVTSYTASATLTAAVFGKHVYYNSASAGTLTLPSASAEPIGSIISISNIIGAGVCTIARADASVIFAFGQVGVTSISLNPGDSIQLVTDGANWVQVVGSKSLGVGQNWQDVTGSRAVNTTYTNTTGKQIMVLISGNTAVGTKPTFSINGVAYAKVGTNAGANVLFTLSVIIPALATYILATNAAIEQWSELR